MNKFRYVLKNIATGDIEFKYFTLEEIERGAITSLMPITAPYEIIARDRYIGMVDSNGIDIYENDTDELGCIVSYIGEDNASCGLDLGWYLQRDNFESFSIIEYKCNAVNCPTNIVIKGTIYDNKNSIKIKDIRFPEDTIEVEIVLQKFDTVNKNGRKYISNSELIPYDIKIAVENPDRIMNCNHCGQCVYIKNIENKGELIIIAKNTGENSMEIICFGLSKKLK